MLTESDLAYCEIKCFRIIGTSISSQQAIKRLKNFRYKGIALNVGECNTLIRIYEGEYGKLYNRNQSSKTNSETKSRAKSHSKC